VEKNAESRVVKREGGLESGLKELSQIGGNGLSVAVCKLLILERQVWA
jgi:hypothetical protein